LQQIVRRRRLRAAIGDHPHAGKAQAVAERLVEPDQRPVEAVNLVGGVEAAIVVAAVDHIGDGARFSAAFSTERAAAGDGAVFDMDAVSGGDDHIRRDERCGAGLALGVGEAAHETPRRLLGVDAHAVVAAKEVIIDQSRPFAAVAVGAVGTRGARTVAAPRLFANAVERGGAAVGLVAHPGDVAAIGAVRALHAGASAEIRFVTFAVAGPAAGIVLRSGAQAPAIGKIGAEAASAGADIGIVALVVVGPLARIVAANRPAGACPRLHAAGLLFWRERGDAPGRAGPADRV